MVSPVDSTRALFVALIVAVAFACLPLVAAAEEGPSVEISDAEIDAFAAALVDVQEIGQTWTQRMQEAESQDEIADMRGEARDEMTGAIEAHGLSVDDYNKIAMAAQEDPELAQRIQQAAGGY